MKQSVVPNTTAFNGRYGGDAPNSTNVVALNGSDDEWRHGHQFETVYQSHDVRQNDVGLCNDRC